MENVLGYIALGANLGDRIQNLRFALQRLQKAPGLSVLRCSPIYEAEAHTLGSREQPDYLNAVVEICTALAPMGVLNLCLEIEKAAGRTRRSRWAPRTLDMDLLTLGTNTCREPGLELPHPRLALRRFVLAPWADLAPDHYVGSPVNATVASLLVRCPDTVPIWRTVLTLESLDSVSFGS